MGYVGFVCEFFVVFLWFGFWFLCVVGYYCVGGVVFFVGCFDYVCVCGFDCECF